MGRKILISHASTDHLVVDPFIELLEAVGFTDELLLYTSFDSTGIPIRKDSSEHIKDAFNDNDLHVVFMLSENFYKRVMCLNEMGAAWVKGCIHDFIFLPDFTLPDSNFIQGALNPRIQGFFIDNKERVAEFIGGIMQEFGVESSEDIGKNIDGYILAVRKAHSEMNKPPVQPTASIFKRPF